MLYPFLFASIFQERVWGGRNLERIFGKKLPPEKVIGESWEISDRPDAVSLIVNGPLTGKSLRWLMENHARELLGCETASGERFPLLVKILDAQDVLSLQVHPPAAVAQKLRGEPKTEMWYFTDTAPNAVIFARLKSGVSRSEFERRLTDGTVAECFHKIPTEPGSVMFLPSGRVHAIGAGNVLFEIQQNSDTTYRVFDWNRVGLDGQPRPLHVSEAMESINFDDPEPRLIHSIYSRNPTFKVRYIISDPLFRVDACDINRGERFYLSGSSAQIVGVVRGKLRLTGGDQSVVLGPGDFALLPASIRTTAVTEKAVELLLVQVGPEVQT